MSDLVGAILALTFALGWWIAFHLGARAERNKYPR